MGIMEKKMETTILYRIICLSPGHTWQFRLRVCGRVVFRDDILGCAPHGKSVACLLWLELK